MKLAEAMVYALATSHGGLTARQLADGINRRALHRRADGQPVTSSQVYAVACHLPAIFAREEGRIRLLM